MVPKIKPREYEFTEEEVLHSEKEIEKRSENLYLGMILGNNYGRKVSLNVLTKEGFTQIDTPIRATLEFNVILDNGIKVPIHCIKEVRIS